MNRIVPVIAFAVVLLQSSCDFFTGSDTAGTERILFVSNESGTWHLYRMSPTGTGVKEITVSPDFQVVNAISSPDGKWVLRKGGPVRDGQTTSTSLYLVNQRGETQYECADIAGLSIHERLSWSVGPQTFKSEAIEVYLGHRVVNMVDCSGGRFSLIPFSNRTIITDASDDGERLLGYTNVEDRSLPSRERKRNVIISVWTAAGDSLDSFGELGDEYLDPVWSSNEQDIAFGLRRGSKQWLYRISADGLNSVRLTDDDYNDIVPIAWAADDTKILTKARRQDELRWRVLMVNARTGGAIDITPFSSGSSYPTGWQSH